MTDLISNSFLFLLLNAVQKLGGHFPVRLAHRLAVSGERSDFKKVESPRLVLHEVAHKLIQSALCPRVDVHLREDLVDSVNGLDRVWIGVWHAGDAVDVVS